MSWASAATGRAAPLRQNGCYWVFLIALYALLRGSAFQGSVFVTTRCSPALDPLTLPAVFVGKLPSLHCFKSRATEHHLPNMQQWMGCKLQHRCVEPEAILRSCSLCALVCQFCCLLRWKASQPHCYRWPALPPARVPAYLTTCLPGLLFGFCRPLRSPAATPAPCSRQGATGADSLGWLGKLISRASAPQSNATRGLLCIRRAAHMCYPDRSAQWLTA